MAYTRDSVHEAVQIKVTYNFTKESENQSLQSCCDFFQIRSFCILHPQIINTVFLTLLAAQLFQTFLYKYS